MNQTPTGSPATGADVRVRFCPSPTGTPHVGLIRTALFNWAYARHVGGTFVFRVEDTDAARDSEQSYRQLLDALRWLGLDWDEGVEVGGPHEPYRQSLRRPIYDDVVSRLRAAGHLYESFSTAEEIEARHEAAGRPKVLGYDGFDRDLTPEQVAAFRADGREPTRERLQSAEDRARFDDTTKCIMCAACTTSCPVFWTDESYFGPQAIVMAHRFIFDSRDTGTEERLEILNDREGVWRCRTTFNCTEACPRGIEITKAIQEVKRALIFRRF